MWSWLARRVISANLEHLNAGDYRPLLRMDADDIRFRFPGDNSWATELVGKEALGRWLQRFVDTGLQISADQVIVQGPLWKMTVCVRGIDYLKAPNGEKVYENRYVLWGTMVWGRLRAYEAYEDTQASRALDDYLATH
ncbi:MAG TPA: nuclear transport factor 2 family protein [Acidimicrobiales bacterium]|jgi:ketosteroid isomerase-like protein|nr:nuclear transport factor 2 family protein [Acidimicrobiales bacterium]